MVVFSATFREKGTQVGTKVRFDHIAWIVSLKFNSFRFVNDPRSLPWTHPSDASNLQQREASVNFEEKSDVLSRFNLLGMISLVFSHFEQLLLKRRLIYITVLPKILCE